VALLIRPAVASDAEQIRANCFPDAGPDEIADGFAGDSEGLAFVAEEDGRIGAHALLIPSGPTGWLVNIAAHPDFRGRGIVQKLLDEIALEAAKLGLAKLCIHVREDNPAARKAYEKAGFRCVGQDGMRGAQLRYERSLASNSVQ
jgi:ribosomal-protein-alanine N-acetyltransferase